MKRAILAVSFGTTYLEAIKNNIDTVVSHISKTYKAYDIYQAYTSNIVRKRLLEKNIEKYDIKSALEYMKSRAYQEIIIVSLHLMAGYEFEKINKAIEQYKKDFNKIQITSPMLYDEKDYKDVANLIQKIYIDKKEAIVFMGHGSNHKNDIVYEKLQNELDLIQKDRYYIATVEGSLDIKSVIEKLKQKNIKKVNLTPLMLVCGEHAHNDMIGEEDSYLSILQQNDIQVNVILKGLGEYEEICDFFANKIKKS